MWPQVDLSNPARAPMACWSGVGSADRTPSEANCGEVSLSDTVLVHIAV